MSLTPVEGHSREALMEVTAAHLEVAGCWGQHWWAVDSLAPGMTPPKLFQGDAEGRGEVLQLRCCLASSWSQQFL